MSGKIVDCHVKRIKGQKSVFTGTQVIILVTHQIRKFFSFYLLLARELEGVQRSVEK